MAELSALALTLGRVLTAINRRHWRHRLPHGRGLALQSQFNKGPRRKISEELDMLCTSRERQHTVSAEIRRSAGLLHLVCIPQPATGGKWLVENSTFAPFRIDEGRDKGRAPSNSVELAIKKKKDFVLLSIKGHWGGWVNKGGKHLEIYKGAWFSFNFIHQYVWSIFKTSVSAESYKYFGENSFDLQVAKQPHCVALEVSLFWSVNMKTVLHRRD